MSEFMDVTSKINGPERANKGEHIMPCETKVQERKVIMLSKYTLFIFYNNVSDI
jgi:hypothetical protein